MLDDDTSTYGFGFNKVVTLDGYAFSAGTLINDTNPSSTLMLARFDTAFATRDFFVPDSSQAYDFQVQDMTVSNDHILIASHRDEFPLQNLSVMCLDTAGQLQWHVIDSSFKFFYDVKLLSDGIGGAIVGGSGRDTSGNNNFIFLAHYSPTGTIDWMQRYYSPSGNFADMSDISWDNQGNIILAGTVMDSTGQVGILHKYDTVGNIIWQRFIHPLAYDLIAVDLDDNIYGMVAPLNGMDAFIIEKRDSSGDSLNNFNFPLPGYFATECGDLKIINNKILIVGEAFQTDKSDFFLVLLDRSLNLIDGDMFDPSNMLGESANEIAYCGNDRIYICGRFNYENQMETSNIGIARYAIQTTGIDKLDPINIRLYPNPSSGTIALSTPVGGLLSVFDTNGKLVFQSLIEHGTTFVPKMNSGLYFIVIENGNKRITRKAIIE